MLADANKTRKDLIIIVRPSLRIVHMGPLLFSSCALPQLSLLIRFDNLSWQEQFFADASETGRDGQQANRAAAIADPPHLAVLAFRHRDAIEVGLPACSSARNIRPTLTNPTSRYLGWARPGRSNHRAAVEARQAVLAP